MRTAKALMLFIDPTPHPYFRNLAKVIQHHLKEESVIADFDEINTRECCYAKTDMWILNFVSFKNGIHEKCKIPYIAVQTEQMNVKGKVPGYKDFLKKALKVWDWSENLRFGYSPIYRLEADQAKDIDILFYGTLNERRLVTLKNLTRKNTLTIVVNEYGPAIWARIHRARVVLSVHYYDQPENDMPRIAPLLSNGVFVICEKTVDPKFNALADYLVIVEKEKIPEAVDYYLAHPFERFDWADKGHEWIRKNPHVNDLTA